MTTVTFWTKYLQAGLPFEYDNNESIPCGSACFDCLHRDSDCTKHAYLSPDDLRILMSKFPESFL